MAAFVGGDRRRERASMDFQYRLAATNNRIAGTGGSGREAVGGGQCGHVLSANCPLPTSLQARTATHRERFSVPKGCTKSSCVGVRPAETRKKSDNTGVRTSSLDNLHCRTLLSARRRTGSRPRPVEAVVLAARSIKRCPSCLRSTGPPFGHGFVGTGDSRIDAGNRIGYRPVDTATGRPCFARKHDPPLAS